MRTKRWRIAGAWLLCMAVIAALFLTGILDRQMIWEDMPYQYLRFDQGLVREAGGAGYGVMNGGPGFDLPAGEYRLKWTIESDGDNRMMIVSSNGAQAIPGEIALTADAPYGEALDTLYAAAAPYVRHEPMACAGLIDAFTAAF